MLRMVRYIISGLILLGVMGSQSAGATGRYESLRDSLAAETSAGELDLKTNLLYDATTSIALGLEYGWGRRLSLDISGSYNPWTFSGGRKWKHWMVQPELRIWTKERQQGHFFGFHALGGVYNLNQLYLPFRAFPETNSYRHEGWGVGGGVAYGYRWNFSDRWGMEGEIGFGYIYTEYDRFCPVDCGVRLSSGVKHYIGPTKIALNLIYRFGAKRRKQSRLAREEVRGGYRPARRWLRDTLYIRDTIVVRDTIQPGIPQTAVRNEKMTLHLQYSVGSSVPLQNKANNTQLAELSRFIERIRRDTAIVIHDIRIIGYCSIEGTAAYNNKLSYDRAQGIADYFTQRYPQLSELLHVEGRGEDWDGLLVELSKVPNLRERTQIEYIVRNVGVYEGRERMLMELGGGAPYRRMMVEVFPQLRRIECSIDYTIRE